LVSSRVHRLGASAETASSDFVTKTIRRRKASEIPKHADPSSKDGQKRFSDHFVAVQRKLAQFAERWDIEAVLLVGGRTIEPSLDAINPGAVTDYLIRKKVQRSIGKHAVFVIIWSVCS
jgi:hypothetical protein